MKVIIYVEGVSDKSTLYVILSRLIEEKIQKGISSMIWKFLFWLQKRSLKII